MSGLLSQAEEHLVALRVALEEIRALPPAEQRSLRELCERSLLGGKFAVSPAGIPPSLGPGEKEVLAAIVRLLDRLNP